MREIEGASIVIAGGSGFLGSSLAAHLLERGARVAILSRSTERGGGPCARIQWDARTLGDWARAVDGADALVNLVGRSVDCVKTPAHRDEILRSRVEATRALGAACRTARRPPPVWVQMSTAHIYGDPPSAVCDEDSPTGFGLAPDVGRAWERAFHEALLPAQRGVVFRTGFVIGRPNSAGEGALGRLRLLARLGFGGAIASGGQGMSWVHQRDLDRLFERAIADETMLGVYVATAPEPVSNRAFMRALRRAVRAPIGLPAPAWLVRLGAPLHRTDPELAIYGRYCVSRRLREEGFVFEFPSLQPALRDLFRPRS